MYSWKHKNIMIPRTTKYFWSVKSSVVLHKRLPPHFYIYQQDSLSQKLDNRRKGRIKEVGEKSKCNGRKET